MPTEMDETHHYRTSVNRKGRALQSIEQQNKPALPLKTTMWVQLVQNHQQNLSTPFVYPPKTGGIFKDKPVGSKLLHNPYQLTQSNRNPSARNAP
jgi:hypothetical protein